MESSIVHGGTSAFFPYEGASKLIFPYEGTSAFFPYEGMSAFFEKSNARIQAQNHESKNTSAKSRVQNSKFYMLGNFLETICWEISWKPYAGKFLENICWEMFWKLHAGNLLMKTMCWEIRVDAGSFLKGVIMAQCYGITLQFQGNGTRSSVLHPGSADLSRMKRSEVREVIGSVEQGMGM